MGKNRSHYKNKKRKYGGKSYEISLTAQRRLVLVSVQSGKEGIAQRDLVCAYEETIDKLYPNLLPVPAPKKLQKNIVPSPEEKPNLKGCTAGGDNDPPKENGTEKDSLKKSSLDVRDSIQDEGPPKKRVKLSSGDEAFAGFADIGDALEKERKAYETPHVQFIRSPRGMVILDFPSKEVDPVQMTISTLKRYVDFGVKPTRWAFKFFPLVSTCYVKMDKMRKLVLDVFADHFASDSTSAIISAPETTNQAEMTTTASNIVSEVESKVIAPSVGSVVTSSNGVKSSLPCDNQPETVIKATSTVVGSVVTPSPGAKSSLSGDNQAEMVIKATSAAESKPTLIETDQLQGKPEQSAETKAKIPPAAPLTPAESDQPVVKGVVKPEEKPEGKQDGVVEKKTVNETSEIIAKEKQASTPNTVLDGKQEKEITYYIEYKKRSNSSVHREEIMAMLMDVIPKNWRNRWKGKTDWVVVFQILGKMCGMSLVKGSDWQALGSFNMNKLQDIMDSKSNTTMSGATDL